MVYSCMSAPRVHLLYLWTRYYRSLAQASRTVLAATVRDWPPKDSILSKRMRINSVTHSYVFL